MLMLVGGVEYCYDIALVGCKAILLLVLIEIKKDSYEYLVSLLEYDQYFFSMPCQ